MKKQRDKENPTSISYSQQHGNADPLCKVERRITSEEAVPEYHSVLHFEFSSEEQPQPSTTQSFSNQYHTTKKIPQSSDTTGGGCTYMPYICGSMPALCMRLHSSGSTLLRYVDWTRLHASTMGAM